MEAVKQLRQYGLSCLTECDRATGVFISHCLDYDLVECGNTPDDAWDNLKVALKHHIEYCYAAYREGLKRQAPKAEWDKFYSALASGRPPRVEEIEIELAEPLPDDSTRMWLQGAMQCEAVKNAREVAVV